MKIELKQVGKRYRENWIFKQVSLSFETGGIYALLGANGSGKSTLLRIIAGIQMHNTGSISYVKNEEKLDPEKLYKHLSFCAPGMEIIEEMTLKEFLKFHFSFKKLKKGVTIEQVLLEMNMTSVQDRFIHEFSSGMKQRVKLAQAFFADTPLLFLDEPCSNLDRQGVELYQDWMQNYGKERILIIASNDEREYALTKQLIHLSDFKNAASV